MRSTILTLCGRVAIGGVFLWAGLWKLGVPSDFHVAAGWLTDAGLLSESGLAMLIRWLPRIEVVLGLCVLLGLYLRLTVTLSSLLLLLFGTILLIGVAIGIDIPGCGCIGIDLLDRGGPPLWIAKNLVLACVGVACAYWGSDRFSLDRAFTRARGAWTTGRR